MTDHLSTIRRDAEALYQIKKYGTANTPPHALRQSIFAACDALEAERLTLVGIVDAWRDGDLSGEDAMPKVRDVLERRASA